MVQHDIMKEIGYVCPEFISNYEGKRFHFHNRRFFFLIWNKLLNELIVQSAN